MVEVDFWALAAFGAAIVGVAFGAGVSYMKLRARISVLENNPLLKAFKDLELETAKQMLSGGKEYKETINKMDKYIEDKLEKK